MAEPAASDAELPALEAALEADSPTLEADAEASEAALEAEEAAPPPTPKIVVAAEVVMVESPLVMVVAKDEVVIAEDSAVAEPLSEPEAEPEAEPVAEPVAEGVPDCERVRWEARKLDGEGTYDDGGGNADTGGCLSRRHQKSVSGPVMEAMEDDINRGGAAHHLHWQYDTPYETTASWTSWPQASRAQSRRPKLKSALLQRQEGSGWPLTAGQPRFSCWLSMFWMQVRCTMFSARGAWQT